MNLLPPTDIAMCWCPRSEGVNPSPVSNGRGKADFALALTWKRTEGDMVQFRPSEQKSASGGLDAANGANVNSKKFKLR